MKDHRKSHHGCKQCKRSKVKCDESKPACLRCLRKGQQCSFFEYFSDAGKIAADNPAPSRLASSTNPSEGSLILEFRSLESTQATTGSKLPRDHHLDLELTHHFLTRTVQTIWSHPLGRVAWQDVIFEHALKNIELLDALLATAAMHKVATMDKDDEERQRYISAALQKRANALNAYIGLLDSPTQEGAITVFVFSMLLAFWAFASRNLPEELNAITEHASTPTMSIDHAIHRSPISQFIDIVRKVQGVEVVRNEFKLWLMTGPLKDFVRLPATIVFSDIPEEAERALTALEKDLDVNSYQVFENKELLTLSMRNMFRLRELPEWHIILLGWPVRLTVSACKDLIDRDSKALVVLAFWAACIHTLNHHWWAKGWPRDLVREISSIVIDQPWQNHLTWPQNIVGI